MLKRLRAAWRAFRSPNTPAAAGRPVAVPLAIVNADGEVIYRELVRYKRRRGGKSLGL